MHFRTCSLPKHWHTSHVGLASHRLRSWDRLPRPILKLKPLPAISVQPENPQRLTEGPWHTDQEQPKQSITGSMAGQKQSVEDYWKLLNAKPAPRKPADAVSMAELGAVTRVAPPPKSLLSLEPLAQAVPINGGATHDSLCPSTRLAHSYDPMQAGIPAEQLSAYLASMQRLINCLTDPDRSTRRQAATTLQTKLLTGDASSPAPSPSLLQAAVCGPLLHPLLGLLSDVAEKCRLVGVEILCHAVEHMPDSSAMLPALLPVLARRMGHLPVLEEGEEVRLGLAKLVAAVVAHVPAAQLLGDVPDLALVVSRCMEDGYQEIKKVGATTLAALAAAVPGEALASHTDKLAAVAVAGLGHPHSRVRTAMLAALDGLVCAEALPAGALTGVVAPGLRAVAYDRVPAVREALFTVLGGWLGARQGSTRGGAGAVVELLPTLLVGVSDPQAGVAAGALRLVEAVGDAWLAHQPPASLAVQDTEMGEGGGGPEVQVTVAVSTCQLGLPYTGRPGAGARAMAAALLPALLPPVAAELTAWTVGQRAAAARSLHTLLVLAEGATQVHLPQLLPALSSAVSDEDADVATGVVRCVHVVGAHVEPARWLPLILDHLANSKLTMIARTNGLVVLSGLLHAAGTAQQPLPDALLSTLVTTLASDDLRAVLLLAGGAGHTPLIQISQQPAPLASVAATVAGSGAGAEPAAVRQQLLGVVLNLVRWRGSACASVAAPLAALLLALWGAEPDPSRGGGAAASAPAVTAAGLGGQASRRSSVEAAMEQLAACCLGSVEAVCGSPLAQWETLLDAHADELLQAACHDVTSWQPESGNFLVVRALLLTAGQSTLARVTPGFYLALRPVLRDPDAPAPIKLAVLQLLDTALDEEGDRGRALGGEGAGGALLEEALLPPLTWRAGKTAAAVRFSAITALASALRRHLLPKGALLRLVNDGTLLPLLTQEMDEDWYVDVRGMACFVAEQLLLAVGSRMGHDPRRALYPELLKRLDDSANSVRIAACRALVAFGATLQRDYCETNAGYLAAGVVIHMDDADTAVQEAACAALEALADAKPEAVRIEVSKVRERFRNKHCCDRVLAACVGDRQRQGAEPGPTPEVFAALAAGSMFLDDS